MVLVGGSLKVTLGLCSNGGLVFFLLKTSIDFFQCTTLGKKEERPEKNSFPPKYAAFSLSFFFGGGGNLACMYETNTNV